MEARFHDTWFNNIGNDPEKKGKAHTKRNRNSRAAVVGSEKQIRSFREEGMLE